jgi:hypothetical protein
MPFHKLLTSIRNLTRNLSANVLECFNENARTERQIENMVKDATVTNKQTELDKITAERQEILKKYGAKHKVIMDVLNPEIQRLREQLKIYLERPITKSQTNPQTILSSPEISLQST